MAGHGSRYSVLGIFFSLLSTPRPLKNAYNPPNLCLLPHFWGIITGLLNNSTLVFSLRLHIMVSPFTKASSSVANTLVDTQIYQCSSSGLRRKSINPIVTIPS